MKKIKNRLIAGAKGGIITSMILMGAGSAFAQTNPDYVPPAQTTRSMGGMHTMHRFNSTRRVVSLAKSLGIPEATVRQELKSGKTVKQILQEHGITMNELDGSGQ